MGRKSKFDDAGITSVVEKYQASKGIGSHGTDLVGQLASEAGVSKQTAYKMLRKGGIHKPRIGNKNEDQTS